ncbi:MAG: hypothetical protein ACI9BF_000845 [Candidatus Paceibacteria bacterium]|jgi:hypothetical protein
MHPELTEAVKERIILGHRKEDIRGELSAAGYDDQSVEQVYAHAYAEIHPEPGDNGKSEDTMSSGVNLSSMETFDGKTVLPSASTLFENSWTFMLSRPDLLMALCLPLAVASILTFVTESLDPANQNLMIEISSIVIGLMAIIAYLCVWATSIYIIANKNTGKGASISEAFPGARRNVGGLIWINILTALVTMGGFLLFIIPGIILSFYLYFAQYVFVKEGVRGIPALLRSRDLVKGNVLALAGRVIVLGLILFVIFIVSGVISGLVFSAFGEGGMADLIVGILFQFVGAGASLIGIHAGMELYGNLSAVRPISSTATVSEGRGKYITLAWLGLALPVLLMFLAVSLSSLNDAKESGLESSSPAVLDEVDTKQRAEQLRQDVRKSQEDSREDFAEPRL